MTAVVDPAWALARIDRLESDLLKALDECDIYQGRIAKAKEILTTIENDDLYLYVTDTIRAALEALEGK